jgi:hypothetical protein
MLLIKKMTSIVKVALLVMLTTAGSTLFANDENNPGVEISKGYEKSFIVSFKYALAKDFKITLRDDAYNTLFKEEVTEVTRLAKNFNLTNLPDGTYFLEVEDATSIFNQMIEIKNDKVLFEKAVAFTVFKPIFKTVGNKIYISALLLNETNVKINIYNIDGDQVYEETIENQTNLEKIFKFVDERPEDYTLVVTYNDRSFRF